MPVDMEFNSGITILGPKHVTADGDTLRWISRYIISFFPTVARAIINTTVGRSPSNVGKEKPKVNACCLGFFGLLPLFLHLRLTPVEWQGETEGTKVTKGRTSKQLFLFFSSFPLFYQLIKKKEEKGKEDSSLARHLGVSSFLPHIRSVRWYGCIRWMKGNSSSRSKL